VAVPTIVINNSTGSNTAASGAGPSTAISGSACNVTSGSATCTITDAVALGGVATDGSAVLWVQTASGRQYSAITAISGSSGAWTLTLGDTVWTTSTNKNWAIGGQRLNFETTNTSTKTAFVDWHAGWTIDLQQTGTNYVLTSTITVIASGTAGSRCKFTSTSGTKPIITSATNSVPLISIQSCTDLNIENLWLTHTAATRGHGITTVGSGAECYYCEFKNLVIDGCLTGINAVYGGNYSTDDGLIENTVVKNCTSHGLQLMPGGCTMTVMSCDIYLNAGDGINMSGSGAAGRIVVIDSHIDHNSGKGMYLGPSASQVHCLTVVSCNVSFNTSDGISATPTTAMAIITTNNIIYGNACGRNYSASPDMGHSRNDFLGGNTSGPYGGSAVAGTADVTLTADPFINSASGTRNFAPNNTAGGGALVRAAAFPTTFPAGSTANYRDGGPAQHQDSGGSATYIFSGEG
jgi:Right handed beta helix region